MSTIVWFRQDLRIDDNPALAHAAQRGPIAPVYILDDASGGKWRMGGASRWWLHHSLAALKQNLGGLVVMRGDTRDCLNELLQKSGASGVVWNRCYEPFAIKRDKSIKAWLLSAGYEAESFNGSLLHEPWEIATQSGTPFKVYTPYWRNARAATVAPMAPAPKLTTHTTHDVGVALDDLNLLPKNPDWARGWEKIWTPGEDGAKARLHAFLKNAADDYGKMRDFPGRPATSRLSPHLHFGEISPRLVWQCAKMEAEAGRAPRGDIEKFLAEIGWREFAHYLLYHFPTLPDENWRAEFDAFPWRRSAEDLRAWQRGQTGYPFVDAGMRELWQTGVMHNRVRMIAASFLIKHLRLDWRAGQDWFWDTLVDADLANNAAGWQWVAGSGADAAPYFRIFNPVAQGEKFDAKGEYVRRWIPELARLPDEFIHKPFAAPKNVLEACGIVLGKTYPAPIVDHAQARAAALAGYEKVKAG